MPLNIPGIPNLNIDSPDGKSSGSQDSKESAGQNDVVFFNVMPKLPVNAEVIDPKLVSVDNEQKLPDSNSKAFFLKYKLYILTTIGVTIACLVAYFIFSQVIKSQYSASTILNPNSNSKPAVKNASSSSDSNITTGFTTPQSWRDKYFPNCRDISLCGDAADPDHDGLTNLQEYKAGTDPNNPDSDQDGLSDGDEVNVFGTNPLSAHTSNNPKFADLDYIKGAYDFSSGQKMTSAQISALGNKMTTAGLHEPTITSLGDILQSVYNFGNITPITQQTAPTTTPVSTTTPSASSTDPTMNITAKQDRDTKRSNTILNVETALIKYKSDNGAFPTASDFESMFTQIKPYLKVATNPKDPINIDPFIYKYTSDLQGADFSLSFYSEVAQGPIIKHLADAQKDVNGQSAETNDNKREFDLEDLRAALLLYSTQNAAGNQTYVFPPVSKYKTALVPDYIQAIPTDPVTGKDYDYEPSKTFDAFTLKATLQSPPTGNTGYICNQVDDCRYY